MAVLRTLLAAWPDAASRRIQQAVDRRFNRRSAQEHLVIEHGIPSVAMHWKVKGYYSHEGDHHKQQSVRSGAVGDLVAVTHGHEQAA